MLITRFLILVFLLFSLTGAAEVWGQCTSCTVILTATNNPAINDGAVVCLNVNRSNQINLGNADNITLCIATGITYSNTFSGLNGDNVVINNYGQIGTSVTPRNITLANNGIFNNSGNYFGSFTSNGGSDLNNSGSYTGNVILNSTEAVFNNSGSQDGALTVNNNTLVNSGTLSLTSLSIGGSSPGITNTSSGIIILDQNSDLSINAPFNNAGSFSFTRDNQDFSIASGVTLTNSGTFSVGRNFTNNGTFNSSEGILNVGRDLTNNGAVLNLGHTIVSRDFTNNNLTTISGSLEIGDDLTNNGSAVIRPLNTNQCNTVFVDDNFTNNNTNGITGSNLSGLYKAPLIVNQAPSPRGLVGNAIVDPNLDCLCGAIFTNNGFFIVPAGVTQITMKAWGGGGKGGARVSNSGRSGGGGAGAYSESTITVTPGETIYYSSGAGSTTESAEVDSWISRASDGSNPILLAKGGNSVANNATIGASGGLAIQGVGTIRTSGGNGTNAGEDGGDGGDSPNGGDGGDGGDGNGNSNGDPGESPGGGGGGAKTNGNNNQSGGSGGNGQITFSYSCEESVDPPSGGCWRYIDDGSISGTVIIEFFEDCTWDAPQGLLEFEVLAIGGGGGGGVRSGGGGGGGGAVHTRALVELRFKQGLAPGTSFPIVVGNKGVGSTDQNERGGNGFESRFDFGGDYQIVAGGGGGGGSDNSNADSGNAGSGSSYNSLTTGFSIISSALYGGSGGGGGHNGNRGNGNYRNGGNAADHSGAGGGGLGGNNGNDALNNTRGGNGANGRRFSTFDITLNRFFGAGGAGGSRENFTAIGGSSGAGGNGGSEEDNNATNGGNAITPGSGGGGGGHDENVGGGRGAKGVVIVRYEIARILPLEYLYFNVNYLRLDRIGKLTWATAQEWENSHFEIERSVNDTRNWTKVGEVTGKGYSDVSVEYAFNDLNLPASGGNIFYRLKQVDLDGDFQYSVTRAIRVEGLDGSTSWIAYPNPSALRSSISVDLLDKSGFADESILIRISDARGIFESYSVSSPEEVSAVVNSYLDQARPGLHILQLIWGNRSEQLKLIRK